MESNWNQVSKSAASCFNGSRIKTSVRTMWHCFMVSVGELLQVREFIKQLWAVVQHSVLRTVGKQLAVSERPDFGLLSWWEVSRGELALVEWHWQRKSICASATLFTWTGPGSNLARGRPPAVWTVGRRQKHAVCVNGIYHCSSCRTSVVQPSYCLHQCLVQCCYMFRLLYSKMYTACDVTW